MARPPPNTTKREIRVTEVTITEGAAARQATIHVIIDDRKIEIPVAPEVRAHWEEQFFRANPTPPQKKRWATLMNVVRAAYKKGRDDAAKEKG